MRRLLAGTTVAFCLLVSAAPAGPSTGEATVYGDIINVTCPGPCSAAGNATPFTDPADVVVTERDSGQQVARVSAEKGRYSLLVPPGRYRIVAVPYPDLKPSCWAGNSRRLQVMGTESVRRRLKVENICIQ